jgi:hypothetical protein
MNDSHEETRRVIEKARQTLKETKELLAEAKPKT